MPFQLFYRHGITSLLTALVGIVLNLFTPMQAGSQTMTELSISEVGYFVDEGGVARFRISAAPAPATDTIVRYSVRCAGNSGLLPAGECGEDASIVLPANSSSIDLTFQIPDGNEEEIEDRGFIFVRFLENAGYSADYDWHDEVFVEVRDNDASFSPEPAM